MSQPLVLAIEPDLRQATIVKRIVREKALAEVTVVDSRDAAIEAMRTCMPDVLLLSALLSPRDEDELMAHLRTLDNAAHLQTHTIPQLASMLGPGEERGSGGLFSSFRRKSKAADTAPVAGCDPDMFADEIRVYLQRAADRKRLQESSHFVAPDMRPTAAAAAAASPADHEDPAAATESSSWASPFEWKPASSSKKSPRRREEAPAYKEAPAPPPAPAPEPVAAAPMVDAPSVIKPVEEPIVSPPVLVEAAPLVIEPPAPVARDVVEQPLIPEPVVTQPVETRPLVAEKVGRLDEPAPAPKLDEPAPKKAAKTVDALRPKPVADRPARLTGGQLRDLLKKHVANERMGDGDRLGPLARWARSDASRPAKGTAITSADVRALISSLAVPAAVASVTYPNGCRIRRVHVPASPEQPAA